MKKTILLIAGAGLAYFLYQKFQIKNKSNVVFKGLKIGGSLISPEIQISLGVQNPTNTGTTLKSIAADLYINDQYIVNFSSFGDQQIKPNSESVIQLLARPKLVQSIKSIFQIIKQKKTKLNAVLKGSANFDGFNVPLNQTVSI